jgi:hypothetical protein
MAANNRSTGGRSGGSAVVRELDHLRKKVKELTLRLEREAKARKLDARLAAVAKKAREQLTREIKALREQGRKLASQLKSTMSMPCRAPRCRKVKNRVPQFCEFYPDCPSDRQSPPPKVETARIRAGGGADPLWGLVANKNTRGDLVIALFATGFIFVKHVNELPQ